jgi:hypothetical protein
MKILVRGSSDRSRPWIGRARRTWSCTDWKLVEVVDVKAGEYSFGSNNTPCAEGDDPPDIEIPWKNPTTNLMGTKMVPDPDRIGQKSYRQLVDDARISIKQTDTVTSEAADAAVEAARREVARLSEENLFLKARVASLESGEALKAALGEIEALKAAAADEGATTKAKGKGRG